MPTKRGVASSSFVSTLLQSQDLKGRIISWIQCW